MKGTGVRLQLAPENRMEPLIEFLPEGAGEPSYVERVADPLPINHANLQSVAYDVGTESPALPTVRKIRDRKEHKKGSIQSYKRALKKRSQK